MILYKIKLLLITLILFIAGCIKKDELTLPVRIQLKIGVSPNDSLGGENNFFSWGRIGIESIRFEGEREAGGDIFFETDPEMNFQKVDFNADHIELISDFDIPRGVYYNMKWDIALKSIVGNEIITEHSLAGSPDIGLIFSGQYKYLNKYGVHLLFAIDGTSQLSFRSEVNSRIVLSENKYDAILFLDPEYTFSTLNRKSINEAEISINKDGHPDILISSNKNKELYETLLSRLSNSAIVVVK